MKSYIIISGGRVDLYSLQEIMDRHLESSRVIAVDKGIETCNKIGIVPDVIVGDFDSASKVTVGVYRKMAKRCTPYSLLIWTHTRTSRILM